MCAKTRGGSTRRRKSHAIETNLEEGQAGSPQGKEPVDRCGRVRAGRDTPCPTRQARSALDQAGHCHWPVQGATSRCTAQATPGAQGLREDPAFRRIGVRNRARCADTACAFGQEKQGHSNQAGSDGKVRRLPQGAVDSGEERGAEARPAFGSTPRRDVGRPLDRERAESLMKTPGHRSGPASL